MTDLWGLQLLTFFFICIIGVYPLSVPEPKRRFYIKEETAKIELADLDVGKPSLMIAKVSQDHLHDCLSESSSSSYDSFKSSDEDDLDDEKPELTDKEKAQAKAKALLRHRIQNPICEPQEMDLVVSLDGQEESEEEYDEEDNVDEDEEGASDH